MIVKLDHIEVFRRCLCAPQKCSYCETRNHNHGEITHCISCGNPLKKALNASTDQPPTR